VWSVTASLFLPELGFTKTPTYSLKEIVEPFILEKHSGGGTGGFPPSSEIVQDCGTLFWAVVKLTKKL